MVRKTQLTKDLLKEMETSAFREWMVSNNVEPPKKPHQLTEMLVKLARHYPNDEKVGFLLVTLECVKYFMLKFNRNMDELLDDVSVKKQTKELESAMEVIGELAGYDIESSAVLLERAHKNAISMRSTDWCGKTNRVFSLNGVVQPKIFYEY